MEENERLAVLVDNANEDVRHVTELLDKTDKEKKRLSEKNAQLTVNGMSHVCYLPPSSEHVLPHLHVFQATCVYVIIVFFLWVNDF